MVDSSLKLLKNPNALRLLSILLFIVAWHLASLVTDPLFIPSPVAVAKRFSLLILDGTLPIQFLSSMHVFLTGFAIAAIGGVPLGILIGRYDYFAYFSETLINVLYVMPFIALLPIVIIWFGIGFWGKVALVFIAAFFPLAINAEAGVRSVDKFFLEVARSFGAREDEMLWKVVLPSSVPFIVAGLRIALGRAIVATVVAEMFVQLTGLGGLLFYYSNTLDAVSGFSPLILLAILSVGVMQMVKWLENKTTSWRA